MPKTSDNFMLVLESDCGRYVSRLDVASNAAGQTKELLLLLVLWAGTKHEGCTALDYGLLPCQTLSSSSILGIELRPCGY